MLLLLFIAIVLLSFLVLWIRDVILDMKYGDKSSRTSGYVPSKYQQPDGE